jgi:hypothetical protein
MSGEALAMSRPDRLHGLLAFVVLALLVTSCQSSPTRAAIVPSLTLGTEPTGAQTPPTQDTASNPGG